MHIHVLKLRYLFLYRTNVYRIQADLTIQEALVAALMGYAF